MAATAISEFQGVLDPSSTVLPSTLARSSEEEQAGLKPALRCVMSALQAVT